LPWPHAEADQPLSASFSQSQGVRFSGSALENGTAKILKSFGRREAYESRG
jgi:hypothetical protein